jgi:hypothetical protein
MSDMRITTTVADQTTPQGPQQAPGVVLRLLAGSLADLIPGEELTASVLQAKAGTAVLNLKGAQVLVKGLPNLQPGTQVAVEVASLAPQLRLALVPPTQPSVIPGPALQLGQEVAARVLQPLPDGHFLLEVQGTQVDATAPTNLGAGTQLTLRVEQLQPQVVLQVVDSTPGVEAAAVQLVRGHLADTTTAAQTLNTLQQTLAQAAAGDSRLPPSLASLQALVKGLVPEGSPPTAHEIAGWVRDGGLHYEAKMAQAVASGPEALIQVAQRDVKGGLLQALHDLGPASAPAGPPALTGALVNHLGQIETQQALNLLAQLHGSPYQLQIPFFMGRKLATALLSVEADGPGQQPGGKGPGHNLLFQLELDELGPLRIDAHVSPSTVRAIFYAEQTSALNQLDAELPAFSERLGAMGYGEVLLTARPMARLAPAKRQQFVAQAAGIPTTINLIDVRA